MMEWNGYFNLYGAMVLSDLRKHSASISSAEGAGVDGGCLCAARARSSSSVRALTSLQSPTRLKFRPEHNY